MKVSEFIKRLEQLQGLAGDVDVVIESWSPDDSFPKRFEVAEVQCSFVSKVRSGESWIQHEIAGNDSQVIQVY